MNNFHDNQGRAWRVVVTARTARDLRALLGIDISGWQDGAFFRRIARDPATLVNVLYVVCMADAVAAGVSDEDFGRAMHGGPLVPAVNALVNAVGEFLGRSQRRLYKAIVAKVV